MSSAVSPENESRTPVLRHFARTLIVSTLCAVCATSMPSAIVHRNSTGRTESLPLFDGSMMHLRSGAQVDVTFTTTEREAVVRSGEALFDVRHTPERPFCVRAEGVLIRDVGTKFVVAVYNSSTVISVLAGEVTVETQGRGCSPDRTLDGQQSHATTALHAGEQAEVVKTPQGSQVRRLSPSATSVKRSLTWLPELHLNNRTLAEALAEFNHFNCQHYRITDPTAAGIHVGGDWDATAPEEFLSAIEGAHHIRPHAPRDTECGTDSILLEQH